METVQFLLDVKSHPVQLEKLALPEVAGAAKVMLVPEAIPVFVYFVVPLYVEGDPVIDTPEAPDELTVKL